MTPVSSGISPEDFLGKQLPVIRMARSDEDPLPSGAQLS